MSSGNGLNKLYTVCTLYTFPKQHILDPSKQKYADDTFKLDKRGVKFSKQIENTVGKGENACYEQFLSSQQKIYVADT